MCRQIGPADEQRLRQQLTGVVPERQAEARRAALVHIDAVIRLFAPYIAPDLPERQRRPQRFDYFKRGEIIRRCLNPIRAGSTVLAIDIAREAMADRVLSFEDDRRMRSEFHRGITAQLNSIARKGMNAKVGIGRGARWKALTGAWRCRVSGEQQFRGPAKAREAHKDDSNFGGKGWVRFHMSDGRRAPLTFGWSHLGPRN